MIKHRRQSYKKIFTPQGELGRVQKTPNLDFLMNIFNIPRIYSVSGFGNWNVGKHSLCTAFIALYWAKFRDYKKDNRDTLVTLAITHDLHEAVTGDILPFFKTPEVRRMIEGIQNDILLYFSIDQDPDLAREIKLIDMISFLYEIHLSRPDSLHQEKLVLNTQIEKRQRSDVLQFAKKVGFERVVIEAFLKTLGL